MKRPVSFVDQLVSIVIPTRMESDNLRKTIDAVRETTDYSNYEFIVAYDTASDIDSIEKGCDDIVKIKTTGLGPALSRNKGAEAAHGEVVAFLDSHIFPISRNWLRELVAFLDSHPRTISTPCISVHNNPVCRGFGLMLHNDLGVSWLQKAAESPYHIPVACACCMALHRKDFFDMGMFNRSFVTWGSEDTELSIRAWLLGYEIFVLPHIEVAHVFKEKLAYDLSWKDVDINALRMAFTHFSTRRIATMLKIIRKHRNIDDALNVVLKSDVFEERRTLLKKRKYNDDWFFDKFT